jgi:uncharacterized membrane protein YphA (DoxX/SURF4 family)
MLAQHLDRLYIPLRFCYGLVPIVAGADKFLNLLTDWSKYLPEFVIKSIPLSPHAFMMLVGVVEIIAGVLVLTKFVRLGAYIVALWLVLIAVAVAIGGFYDIAVRDLVMALGAYTLGGLAALRGDVIIPRLWDFTVRPVATREGASHRTGQHSGDDKAHLSMPLHQ